MDFHVILVEPRYDGNIGSVARAMKNFGFKDLILVNPPEIGSEGRRNSMHARDILENARSVDSFDDVVGEYDFLVGTTAQVAGDGNPLRNPVFPDGLANAVESEGKIGLCFGREDYGLLNDEIDRCDVLVTIPTNREYPTLNLSHAVCVILYALNREANRKRMKLNKFRELDGERKRVMLEYYDGIVDRVYDRDYENGLAKKTFRHLIGRAFISGNEAQTLIGLLRHVRERLG